jgi:putative membrane protein
MERTLRSVACAAAAAALLAGCASGDDKPYAHESMRHPTAAEQLFGTTGSEMPTSSHTSMAPQTSTVARTLPAPTTQMAPITVPQTVARVSPSDANFAQDVAASNATEIELARLAYVRAQAPEVRQFAQQMLIDHREMAIKLDNFALERGYLVAWQIEPEKVALIERLSTLESASFDRAYMDEMVAAHIKAVARLEAQAASGRETASIANESLPTVRHHLEMARDLDARL